MVLDILPIHDPISYWISESEDSIFVPSMNNGHMVEFSIRINII